MGFSFHLRTIYEGKIFDMHYQTTLNLWLPFSQFEGKLEAVEDGQKHP